MSRGILSYISVANFNVCEIWRIGRLVECDKSDRTCVIKYEQRPA